MERRLRLFDDSGLLSIVDLRRYSPFVGDDWTYEQLLRKFQRAMAEQAMLVWDCGDGGGPYDVLLRSGLTTQRGFREATGSVRTAPGKLHFVSYDALTMAAQFADEKLPAKTESEFAFDVAGDVRIRVVQMFDPRRTTEIPEREVHFIIEVEPGDAPPWTAVAWQMSPAAEAPPTPSAKVGLARLRGLLRRFR